MIRRHHPLALALLAILAWALPLRADDDAAKVARVLEARAPSIVTVRLVLSVEFGGRSQEIRNQILGVIVDASGLVMAANEAISPQLGPPEVQDQIKVTPGEMKIVIGNETKEREAYLVAKDTKLGLAFLQIKDMEGLEALPVVFGEKRKVAVGQQLVSVARLGKGYDYAPYFRTMRVNGELEKPRRAFLIEGRGIPALPCFDLDGEVVGALVQIESGVADEGGDGNYFVVNAKTIGAKIKQALRQAREMQESSAKGPAETGDEPEPGDGDGGGGEKPGDEGGRDS